MTDLILASKSPRRLQLLEQLDLTAEVIVGSIDEAADENELPQNYVLRLAVEKAQAVRPALADDNLPIIAADTIVEKDGELLGKPKSKEDAFLMWQKLSGQKHYVHTAMAVLYQGHCYTDVSSSSVQFKSLTEAEMLAYWQTGEPQDKAGAYAIQGFAASWIEQICGSYSSIMGLDLFQCARLLEKTGIKVL